MLERLYDVHWQRIAQPEWNRPDEVPRAIQAVAEATNDNARDAYNRLLFALGNNHAGTYYPIVLWALPFLGEILCDGNAISKEIVLDVFVDLAGAFCPEPGFETVLGPNGMQIDMRGAAIEAMTELRANIEQCRDTTTSNARIHLAAKDLLELLDNGSKV